MIRLLIEVTYTKSFVISTHQLHHLSPSSCPFAYRSHPSIECRWFRKFHSEWIRTKERRGRRMESNSQPFSSFCPSFSSPISPLLCSEVFRWASFSTYGSLVFCSHIAVSIVCHYGFLTLRDAIHEWFIHASFLIITLPPLSLLNIRWPTFSLYHNLQADIAVFWISLCLEFPIVSPFLPLSHHSNQRYSVRYTDA